MTREGAALLDCQALTLRTVFLSSSDAQRKYLTMSYTLSTFHVYYMEMSVKFQFFLKF